MKTKKQQQGQVRKDIGLFVLLAILVLTLGATLSFSYSVGDNYRNVSVDTRVNITNAKPEVLSVIIENGAADITLSAGTTRTVECNATVRDWNGAATIGNVTAIFYDNSTATLISGDDNNEKYSNSSCVAWQIDGYYANYTCTFDVWYYANASNEWICNVTANDTYDFQGIDYGWGYNTTEILALYALNVTPLIDYGEMAVEDTSSAVEANITNFGNQRINISVYGYGATPGDGLAFVCAIGTISIENEKFDLNPVGDFDLEYTSLSSTPQIFNDGLTMEREIIDGTQIINSTYWRLYVPPNPFGGCNGTIVFQAESTT